MWCVAFHRHQFVDDHAAGLADAPEVVALEVDQHHVLGAFLRMPDQLADAFGVIVASETRAGAGDRPGFHHIAMHRHQALRRGTDHAPANAAEHPRERRRVVAAQALEQGRRIQRGIERNLPAARQVGLEHVAGRKVIQHARHAIDIALRRVFIDPRGRLPLRQRRRRCGTRDIRHDPFEPGFLASFGDSDAFARAAVAQYRRRAAQRAGHRQTARGRRQRQHRFDLRRQFIAKQQGPATAERQAGIAAAGQAVCPPLPVQHVQETAFHARAVLVADHAIAPKRERFAGVQQQHVPASVRPGRAGFQQHPVARWIEAMQVEQVEAGGKGSADHRRSAPHRNPPLLRKGGSRHQMRRNTRVPLVPPKPKPFDTATCTCASRAVFGT